MLEHLGGRRFNTIQDLLSAMKASKLRDKRYCSIHMFCRYHLRGYEPPPVPPRLLRRSLLRCFERLELGHLKFCQKPFFNYNFLLEALLSTHGLGEYCQYIKKLRCEKRKQFYRDMYDTITNAYSVEAGQAYVLSSPPQTEQPLDDRDVLPRLSQPPQD